MKLLLDELNALESAKLERRYKRVSKKHEAFGVLESIEDIHTKKIVTQFTAFPSENDSLIHLFNADRSLYLDEIKYYVFGF